MNRLLYTKQGNAVWISHLDLMRTFQRCFRRAGIQIKQTEGFSPHAFVSIALPLSVGAESQCEILDFTLVGETELSELPEKLNHFLPEGIQITEAYDSTRKIKELTHLRAKITLQYDAGVPSGAEQAVRTLLTGPTLLVEKKTKKGPAEVDLRPMLRECDVNEVGNRLVMHVLVCAQNPSLNPDLLVAAVRRYLPQAAPDAFLTRRLEVLDEKGNQFR